MSAWETDSAKVFEKRAQNLLDASALESAKVAALLAISKRLGDLNETLRAKA